MKTVKIIKGEHKGKSGVVIEQVALTRGVCYLVKLKDGPRAYVYKSDTKKG